MEMDLQKEKSKPGAIISITENDTLAFTIWFGPQAVAPQGCRNPLLYRRSSAKEEVTSPFRAMP